MKLFGMLLLMSFLGIATISDHVVTAPEISMENPEGETINLSSLRGNIVLVDFWASWCAPCRNSRAGLKTVYDQFKNEKFKNAEGFEIYSVSLDKNKEQWIKAINTYDLNWDTHVSDLKGWKSAAVKTYGIKGVPNNVLLNEKGEIIAKNIYKEDLVAALNAL